MISRYAVIMLVLLCGSVPAWAQHRSPPTVIGATGRPYGPTQAEYQYRLRYGHPSPGSNGRGMEYVNGYPAGNFGGYGYGYNPYLYMNIGPYVTPPSSGYYFYPSTAYYGVYGNINSPYPYVEPYLGQATPQMLLPLDGGLGAGLPGSSATNTKFPTITNPAPIIQPSAPKAVETSFEFQTQGDFQLQQLNYMAASERYRKAIEAARDRADPRYRMAVSLAARSRFAEAVDQLKLAGQLDPAWPQHATSLGILFGEQNNFEKTRVKQRIAEWTLQDARDPNRLFLLGAILYLDGDANSQAMIDTAILLAGPQTYLTAFKTPRIEPGAEPTPAANLNQAPAAGVARPAAQPPKPNLPGNNSPIPNSPSKPANPLIIPPAVTAPGNSAPASASPLPEAAIPAIPPLPETSGKTMNLPQITPVPAPDANHLTGPNLPPLP